MIEILEKIYVYLMFFAGGWILGYFFRILQQKNEEGEK